MKIQDIQKLKILQMKFLKRTLQTHTSTSNYVVNLELGIIPIKQEMDLRKLVFLHHIVSLEENDPVKKLYNQQGRFKNEQNSYNEIVSLKQIYKIVRSRSLIAYSDVYLWD